MIVDECDQYELQDLIDTFNLNLSTAYNRVISIIVSRHEVGEP